MIGNGYWTTGITVTWQSYAGTTHERGPHSGWGASLKFHDDGFWNDDADHGRVSTQGSLTTRYAIGDGDYTDGLTVAIDILIDDATRLGIHMGGPNGFPPRLYVESDGEREDVELPDDWRAILAAQAARLGGWEFYAVEELAPLVIPKE